MNRSHTVALSVSIALVIPLGALASCGADEDVTEGGSATSAEEFRTQLDELCVERQQASVDALEPLGGPRAPTDFDEQLEQSRLTLPVREDTVAQLTELTPPDELASDFDAYLAAQEDALAAGQRALAAGEKGDEKTYQQEIEANQKAAEESRSIAADLGLTACAGELEPEDEEAVRAVVEEVETLAAPQQCAELFTESYVENNFGKEFGDATNDKQLACEQFQESLGPKELAESIEIVSVMGPAPRATVEVVPEGGPNDGATETFQVIEQDGEWLVNDIAIYGGA